jgi:hypothetical protein
VDSRPVWDRPLDNETVVDPPFMRPSIRYVTGKDFWVR